MEFLNTHILSSSQFSKDDLGRIFSLAERFLPYAQKKKQGDLLQGKVLATLFFEPSTRTRFSFETAMLRLGGSVITHADMVHNSSITKQETLEDTGHTVSMFSDVIAMRHPKAGAVAVLSRGSTVPVLNAGDGPGDHPTQGLLDAFTIYRSKHTLDGLTVGLIGDLKYSRVFHSQVQLLSHFDVRFVLVSPKELSLPQEYVDLLTQRGRRFSVTESVQHVIGDLDVVSTNRLQEERFSDRAVFERLRKHFVFDNALVSTAQEDAIVLNPLPRVDELLPDVDENPRAKYWEQITNGIAVRMALLALVLGQA